MTLCHAALKARQAGGTATGVPHGIPSKFGDLRPARSVLKLRETRPMRTSLAIRISAASVALATVLAPSRDARAQAAVVTPITNPGRTVGIRDLKYFPYWINRQDCLDDDQLTFSLALTGAFTSYQLQVWAGEPATDCTTAANRTGEAATCWEVATGTPTQTPFVTRIKARDIVGKHTVASGVMTTVGSIRPGTIADCTSATQLAQKVTLSFIFVTGDAGTAVPNPAQYQMGYDIWGPDPPTGVVANPGETRILLSWTSSTSTDIVRYDFYCDPPPGATRDAGVTTVGLLPPYPGLTPLAFDSGFGTGGVPFGTGGSPVTGAGGAGGTLVTGTGGAGGVLFDAGSTGTGGTVAVTPPCAPNSPLVPGEPVDKSLAGYYCGGIDGPAATSSGKVEGLLNDVNYAVTVVGVDGVLNPGIMSNQVCAAPVPVTDFFELYRSYGGKGGGGLCSVSRPSRDGERFAVGFGALVVLSLGRRKRRR